MSQVPKRRQPMRCLALVAALLGATLALPAGATAQSIAPWSSAAPPLTSKYDPTSSNICVSGDPRCIDSLLAEMKRRTDARARTCSHNVIFSLAYWRTTQQFERAVDTSGFFSDPRFLRHQSAVFGSYYFTAYDRWSANPRDARVPKVWKLAFDEAVRKSMPASGDLSLGISAHVNRDLPFVLAQIGLVKPSGASRKPDHDKVNAFLEKVTLPLIEEIARRFDPTMRTRNAPGYVDEAALFELIRGWREHAWRNAERLVNAPTATARSLVAQDIEETSYRTSLALLRTSAYGDDADRTARQEWCAEHGRG